MASAVATLSGVNASRSAMRVFASSPSSTVSSAQCNNLKALCVSRHGTFARAMQANGSMERLKPVVISRQPFLFRVEGLRVTLRRVRFPAAEGSRTARPSETAPVASGKSTFDSVCEVIAEQLVDVKVEDLEPGTKFSDLGADSLDTVEIMMSLEEKFKVNFEEEGTENISTVKDAADLIDLVVKKK